MEERGRKGGRFGKVVGVGGDCPSLEWLTVSTAEVAFGTKVCFLLPTLSCFCMCVL